MFTCPWVISYNYSSIAENVLAFAYCMFIDCYSEWCPSYTPRESFIYEVISKLNFFHDIVNEHSLSASINRSSSSQSITTGISSSESFNMTDFDSCLVTLKGASCYSCKQNFCHNFLDIKLEKKKYNYHY